jgi:hypothetical protein
MRRLVVIAAALIVTATAGVAQSPIPDLKGTLEGDWQDTAVRYDGAPDRIATERGRARPRGHAYSRRSGRPADLGHDVIRK